MAKPTTLTEAAEGAGVGTVMAIQAAMEGQQACALGQHAWVPWLRLDNGAHVTCCVRCRHHEQWDY